jgi:hypothetical protein
MSNTTTKEAKINKLVKGLSTAQKAELAAKLGISVAWLLRLSANWRNMKMDQAETIILYLESVYGIETVADWQGLFQ